MKRFFFYPLFFFFFVCQIPTVLAQSTRKVLFIGNSYTAVNNLPQLIADAALSVSDTLIFDSHTPGGYKLLQHSTDALTKSKIMAGGWQYVVMQGQSQEPVTSESNFYTGAINLISFTKQYNPCAVPLLYMTWGRKNGDALNCPNIPVMCTYEGMDTTIRNDYLTIADWYRTEVSPVSVVWKYLRLNHPSINLYQLDESHPSAEGSYAAACCFYAAIFKKDPSLITFNFGLNPTVAAIIRNAAKVIVFNSLNIWDYKKLPIAEFSYKIGAGVNEVIFTNTSKHADNYSWNFGNLTTSTVTSPTQSYASNGTYSVTLTTSNCDLQGVHVSVMDTSISFCNHTPSISPTSLSLCPGGGAVLWTQAGSSYQWYNNGIPIQGATSQSLLVTRSSTINLIDFPLPSVLTSNAGCAELSQESAIEEHGWMSLGFILSFNTIGNVLSGDKVCNGEILQLVTSFPENHITQWYKSGLAIPLANTNTLAVNASGIYKVKITHPMCANIGGFSDSVYYEFIECAIGLKENSLALLGRIYPNPVTEFLRIEINGTLEKKPLQIFNSLGILVKEVEVLELIEINTSDFPSGLYFVRLKNNEQQALKFIKN